MVAYYPGGGAVAGGTGKRKTKRKRKGKRTDVTAGGVSQTPYAAPSAPSGIPASPGYNAPSAPAVQGPGPVYAQPSAPAVQGPGAAYGASAPAVTPAQAMQQEQQQTQPRAPDPGIAQGSMTTSTQGPGAAYNAPSAPPAYEVPSAPVTPPVTADPGTAQRDMPAVATTPPSTAYEQPSAPADRSQNVSSNMVVEDRSRNVQSNMAATPEPSAYDTTSAPPPPGGIPPVTTADSAVATPYEQPSAPPVVDPTQDVTGNMAVDKSQNVTANMPPVDKSQNVQANMPPVPDMAGVDNSTIPTGMAPVTTPGDAQRDMPVVDNSTIPTGMVPQADPGIVEQDMPVTPDPGIVEKDMAVTTPEESAYDQPSAPTQPGRTTETAVEPVDGSQDVQANMQVDDKSQDVQANMQETTTTDTDEDPYDQPSAPDVEGDTETDGEPPEDWEGDVYEWTPPDDTISPQITEQHQAILDVMSGDAEVPGLDAVLADNERRRNMRDQQLEQQLHMRGHSNSTFGDQSRTDQAIAENAAAAKLAQDTKTQYMQQNLPALQQMWAQGSASRAQHLTEFFGFMDRQFRGDEADRANATKTLSLLLNLMGTVTTPLSGTSYSPGDAPPTFAESMAQLTGYFGTAAYGAGQ